MDASLQARATWLLRMGFGKTLGMATTWHSRHQLLELRM